MHFTVQAYIIECNSILGTTTAEALKCHESASRGCAILISSWGGGGGSVRLTPTLAATDFRCKGRQLALNWVQAKDKLDTNQWKPILSTDTPTSSCHGLETAPVANFAANSWSDTAMSTPFTDDKGSMSRTSFAYTALGWRCSTRSTGNKGSKDCWKTLLARTSDLT